MAKKKIDIKKHELVPKHTKLSKKDKEKLLEEHNISSKQLPKILKDDPAIADMDAEVGDVIKIERKSRTAGETVYYREVSNV